MDAVETKVGALSTKELGNVIDGIVKENIKLSDTTRLFMSRVYDRFRHQISVALTTHDLSDSAGWIALIGDMMKLVNSFKIDGAEKKEIILETIRIVIRFEVPADKKEACDVLLSTVLVPAIDLAVYFKNQFVDRKKISLGFCGCE